MQYLKEEVRNNILKEALNEFKEKGYRGASIRSIAKNANTSVGNLYKYFNNKESLYEELIGSVYNRLMGYINQFSKVEINDKAEEIFYGLLDNILDIFKNNSIELSVLLNKGEGSKYENCKNSFVEFITRIVTETMEYELSLEGKILQDNFIIYLVSNSLVESISIILEEKEDGEEVKKLIYDLISLFYMDIINKLNIEDKR